MAAISEITKLQNRISKLNKNPEKDQRKALDIIKMLNNMEIPLEILLSTRIGQTINEFRKSCKDNETKSFCKILLKKWKELSNVANIKNNNLNDGDIKQDNDRKCDNKKKVKEAKVEKKDKIKNKSKIPVGDAINVTNNGQDNVRLKSRMMILDALGTTNENLENINIKQLADELEESIFCVFKNIGRLYRNRVISRVFNLRDPKNPSLRTKFLFGTITPANMAVLTHEEMASDDKKNLRASYRKEGIDKSRMAIAQGASTGLLQCGKCKKRNCSYNQMQTRSADEPMTTFAVCNDCGNRWKF